MRDNNYDNSSIMYQEGNQARLGRSRSKYSSNNNNNSVGNINYNNNMSNNNSYNCNNSNDGSIIKDGSYTSLLGLSILFTK